jgi:hypothetical protein
VRQPLPPLCQPLSAPPSTVPTAVASHSEFPSAPACASLPLSAAAPFPVAAAPLTVPLQLLRSARRLLLLLCRIKMYVRCYLEALTNPPRLTAACDSSFEKCLLKQCGGEEQCECRGSSRAQRAAADVCGLRLSCRHKPSEYVRHGHSRVWNGEA